MITFHNRNHPRALFSTTSRVATQSSPVDHPETSFGFLLRQHFVALHPEGAASGRSCRWAVRESFEIRRLRRLSRGSADPRESYPKLATTVKPLTFRMEKSANYPYHLLRMIYSFYIYAGTASFGGSHPNAFNFFKYAWIFRSALN